MNCFFNLIQLIFISVHVSINFFSFFQTNILTRFWSNRSVWFNSNGLDLVVVWFIFYFIVYKILSSYFILIFIFFIIIIKHFLLNLKLNQFNLILNFFVQIQTRSDWLLDLWRSLVETTFYNFFRFLIKPLIFMWALNELSLNERTFV